MVACPVLMHVLWTRSWTQVHALHDPEQQLRGAASVRMSVAIEERALRVIPNRSLSEDALQMGVEMLEHRLPSAHQESLQDPFFCQAVKAEGAAPVPPPGGEVSGTSAAVAQDGAASRARGICVI